MLTHLLHRWSKLAPKECKFRTPNPLARIFGGKRGYYFPTSRKIYRSDRAENPDILVPVIIDAIQKRRWEFDLRCEQKTYTVIIYSGSGAVEGTSTNLAYAFLSTYLQAIRRNVVRKLRNISHPVKITNILP